MSASFETSRLSRDYPFLLASVIEQGAVVESRVGKTAELLNFTLHLEHPFCCVVGRKGFSKAFMEAEIAMLLAGLYDGELLAAITPRAASLITPLTAYGPRVALQMLAVEAELRGSPESRRAVVYVGRHQDLQSVHIDGSLGGEMPCTCLWQFILRENRLHMSVYMRSWDLVWGLGYDVPCFVAEQVALATALGVGVGTYTHHAGSAHVYERHWDLPSWDNEQRGCLTVPYVGRSIAETQMRASGEIDRLRREHVQEGPGTTHNGAAGGAATALAQHDDRRAGDPRGDDGDHQTGHAAGTPVHDPSRAA